MSLARLWFAFGLVCAVSILPAPIVGRHLASVDTIPPVPDSALDAPAGAICSYEFLNLNDPCVVRDADGKALLTFGGYDANDRLVWARGFESLDTWRAYASNDPCLASDKAGQVGWGLSGGKDDIFWQLQAILCLCPEYRNLVEAIESRLLLYNGNRKTWLAPTIQLTGADNRFDLATATIFWNPAVSSAAGGVQPWDRFDPLVALAHELVHAYQRIVEDETTYSSPLQVAAMKEENLIRQAFYRRVPGYSDLRPRPGNAGFYLGTMLQYLFDDVGWADWLPGYVPLLDVFLEEPPSDP